MQVCDQPHPVLVRSMLQHCLAARIDEAYVGMKVLGGVESGGLEVTGAGLSGLLEAGR